MTLSDAIKVAMLLEDLLLDDFDYKVSAMLNQTFPEFTWITQQQCPPIFWISEKK